MSRGQGQVLVTGWGQSVWVDRAVLHYYTQDGWTVSGSRDD